MRRCVWHLGAALLTIAAGAFHPATAEKPLSERPLDALRVADAGEVAADATAVAKLAGPNGFVSFAAPVGENNNAAISADETVPGELYALFNEFAAPGFVPSLVGQAWNPTGAPGAWISLGLVPPLSAIAAEAWNPSIASLPVPGHFMMQAEYDATFGYFGPSAIATTLSPGAGAAFGGFAAAVPGVGVAGATWVDFPRVLVDDGPLTPPPVNGTVHQAWVEYVEGGDGDPNGDGNPYNDPADGYAIFYSYSTTSGGVGAPFPFPAFLAPVVTFAGPVNVIQHPTHRPSLALNRLGGPGPLGLPPGTIYLAHSDGAAIYVDAAPPVAAGGVFGALTGGFGPIVAAPIAAPIPPVVPPTGEALNNAVDIEIIDNPVCSSGPGAIAVVYTDGFLGDLDIFIILSYDEGLTWTAPIRVNQDPVGIGTEQWAPQIVYDAISGDICVVYKDMRRGLPSSEIWLSTSSDCGATWVDALISDAGPVPPVTTQIDPLGRLFTGDYIDIDANAGVTAYSIFNDGRNGADQDVFAEGKKDFDFDNDGFPGSIDCDDTNPAIFPGAPEIPDNGIDEDCNGFDAVTCYTDADGDTFGDPSSPVICPLGVCGSCGLVSNALDCNDTDGSINPGAVEIPDDGIDQNCDGFEDYTCWADADTDGFGDPATPIVASWPLGSPSCVAGAVSNNLDCNDAIGTIFPGAPEIACNGIDEDCDGIDLCASCCVGTVGDVNCDTFVGLPDLSTLIDHLFITFTPLCCPEAANVAAGDCIVSLPDLSALIDHLFITFSPLAPCPGCP